MNVHSQADMSHPFAGPPGQHQWLEGAQRKRARENLRWQVREVFATAANPISADWRKCLPVLSTGALGEGQYRSPQLAILGGFPPHSASSQVPPAVR